MNNEEIKNTEEQVEKTDEILDLGVNESEFEPVENIEEENKESEVDNNGDNK